MDCLLGARVLPLAILSAACSSVGCSGDSSAGDRAEQPQRGPSLGKADSNDKADRNCAVVLRRFGQPHGLPSNRVGGTNWVVFEGWVDVHDGTVEAPSVLFSSPHTAWQSVAGEATPGAPDGFRRYAFKLSDGTLPMGDSTAWKEMRIELVPFLPRPTGRLFDHNRNFDDFANYVVDANAPAIPDDSGTGPTPPKSSVHDSADYSCTLVLRQIRQPFGLPANPVGGVNWVVFEGQVDVDEDQKGTPRVLYSSRYTGWREAGAKPVPGAQPGYQRYEFVLDDRTVPAGVSSAWSSMKIEFIPFLQLPDGGRLFDHNRSSAPAGNYVLTSSAAQVADDGLTCQ